MGCVCIHTSLNLCWKGVISLICAREPWPSCSPSSNQSDTNSDFSFLEMLADHYFSKYTEGLKTFIVLLYFKPCSYHLEKVLKSVYSYFACLRMFSVVELSITSRLIVEPTLIHDQFYSMITLQECAFFHMTIDISK